MKKYSMELYVGLFVLAGILCLAYLTVKLGKMEIFSSDGYTVSARFASVTGLKVGASIEIAGVPVGKVSGIRLNPGDFFAIVDMQINRGIELTEDSIVSVKTSGLIGDRYLSVSLGAGDPVAPGKMLRETESAVDIESLISKYVFGGVK